MKETIFACLFLLFSLESFCQNKKWENAKDWQLYRITDKRQYSMPPDSLKRLPHISLNSDTMKYYMDLSMALPKEKEPVWMGKHLCTAEIYGSVEKLYISDYAGFFYDVGSKTYYQIPEREIDSWKGFFDSAYSKLELLSNLKH